MNESDNVDVKQVPEPAASGDAGPVADGVVSETPAPAAKTKPTVRKTAAKKTQVSPVADQVDAAIATPVQTKRRAGRVTFFTSRTSMFSDGYDLERERIEVLPLIQRADAGEPIEAAHPMFDRYMLYLDRMAEHQHNSRQRQSRADQASPVSRVEVKQYQALGGLTNADDEGDSIVIHTKEAFQLFIGRAADPDNNKAPRIISFKKVGAAYRLLWNLSTNNNPYADWALIDLSERRNVLQEQLSKSVTDLQATLSEMAARRGVKYSIAKNGTPQELPIKFRSPYGYAMVESLAEFDFLVRLIRTLVFKARLTVPLADQLIRDHMRLFRAHFNEVKRFEKYLGEPDLLLLTRNDFLPTADDVARKRVAKCIEMFGEVPRNVFSMELAPPFKSHRGDLGEAERELLRKVSTGVMDAADAAEAASAEAGAQGLV